MGRVHIYVACLLVMWIQCVSSHGKTPDQVIWKSIDSQHILIWSDEWLAVIDIASMRVRALRVWSGCDVAGKPHVGFDGSIKILVTVCPEQGPTPTRPTRLLMWDVSSDKVTDIGVGCFSAWSPSGRWICYASMEPTSLLWHGQPVVLPCERLVLWRVSDRRRIMLPWSMSLSIFPTWHPKETHIAVRGYLWSSRNRFLPYHGEHSLFVIDLRRKLITTLRRKNVSPNFLMWSLDGKFLYYADIELRYIYRWELSTGETLPIYKLSSRYWFKQGAIGVLLTNSDEGGGEVKLLRADNGRLERLFYITDKRLGKNKWIARWLGVSPIIEASLNGDEVVFTLDWRKNRVRLKELFRLGEIVGMISALLEQK